MNLNERADKDFSRARRRAFLKRVGAYLRKDPASNRLLSFDEVRSALGAVEQSYLGMRVVPVAKIVGSLGRHRDFDRAFLLGKPSIGERWKKIDRAGRPQTAPPEPLEHLRLNQTCGATGDSLV